MLYCDLDNDRRRVGLGSSVGWRIAGCLMTVRTPGERGTASPRSEVLSLRELFEALTGEGFWIPVQIVREKIANSP